MITPNEFKQMQETARLLISVVFDNEQNFKETFLKDYRWDYNDYELERVHLSGTILRVTIRFEEDYSTFDVYLCLSDVYDWYLELCEKETGDSLTESTRPDNVEDMEAYQSGVFVESK